MKMEHSEVYTGHRREQVAFPLGGIGAGMFCLQGCGAIGSMSLRNAPDLYHEPHIFSAIHIRQEEATWSKVLEGPVPRYKVFGTKGSLSGIAINNNYGKTYGLPRFRGNSFAAQFPFAQLDFEDEKLPVKASLLSYSPFIPLDPDASSLPAATLQYRFENTSAKPVEAVYYFNTFNFMQPKEDRWFPMPKKEKGTGLITQADNALILTQPATPDNPSLFGECCIAVDAPEAVLDTDWFSNGWFDAISIQWKQISEGAVRGGHAPDSKSVGGSIAVRFSLKPGEIREIPLYFAWYVPTSDLRLGEETGGDSVEKETYSPWYAGRFHSAAQVMTHYRENQSVLFDKTRRFSDALFSSTIPEAALEALTANLSILKSPTVLRQTDGRLWAWEGCNDEVGSCHGSCTHVWNYAQAFCHLFPSLERSFRDAEFHEDQNDEGHQEFRSALPIRPSGNSFYAASDGQLGGIMKMYREWRVSGNNSLIEEYWPLMKKSMDYCIRTWDKKGEGVLKEPHHNTYDIEFWGADGMCSSFYLGALKAMTRMGKVAGADPTQYEALYEKGRRYLENDLYNGEYFIQKVEWTTLEAKMDLSEEPEPSRLLMEQEGPKYQYGNGCISDGVLGAWMAAVCGLGDILDPEKVKSHLLSVFRHNFKRDLTDHANPQRPGYALGDEGGLLLCSWPNGDRPSLPFVYSDEVWTGIEHQVASHLMLFGCMDEALDIIRTCRARYDGVKRNPFNEYECGHWYARALASYSYLQAYSGVWYDAVKKTLYVSAANTPEFQVFLCTETGYGIVKLVAGAVNFTPVEGTIAIDEIIFA